MATIKTLKDTKHKVVIIFYEEESEVYNLADLLDTVLPHNIQFTVCENVQDAHNMMNGLDSLGEE